MVALDDMTSGIPALVVPANNDDISEEATGSVNAVYFVNWFVFLLTCSWFIHSSHAGVSMGVTINPRTFPHRN
jgi:hypothetical protein